MKILLDSHILLWHAFGELDIYVPKAVDIVGNFNHEIYFSSVNLWEIAIKSSLNKPDFMIDVEKFTQGLLDDGFKQLLIKNEHLFYIKSLPHIHKDPFDRLLIAQAKSENCQFLTIDEKILQYPYDFIIK